MAEIKTVASGLRDGKLQNLETLAPELEEVVSALRLASTEEAVVLVAVMDRQCSGQSSDVADLSDYFDCSLIDVVAFMSTINSLLSKGLLTVKNRSETLFVRKKFALRQTVFDAIAEGREVVVKDRSDNEEFDRFAFCSRVDALIRARKEEFIETEDLFAKTYELENENVGEQFISEVRALVPDVEARALFYEICFDFNPRRGLASDLDTTLDDMYDSVAGATKVRKEILDETHPLIATGLVEVAEKSKLLLSDDGIRLFYKELASVYMPDRSGLNRFAFVQEIHACVTDINMFRHTDSDVLKRRREASKIESQNPQLTMLEKLKVAVPDYVSRVIFYMICHDVMECNDYGLGNLNRVLTRGEEMSVRRQLTKGLHPLQKAGLVEMTSGDFSNASCLKLTDKGKELFLEDDIDLFEEKVSSKDIIACDGIPQKRLFFDPDLEAQLSELQNSLEESNYAAICERMKEHGQASGIAVLLYGKPGTGKTESVMQIARATGRDIIHVDISQTKSCWFGESEKKIKQVFDSYRRLSKSAGLRPILLFNEADAVLSKRKDSNFSNVAQTENAIQNIILEELERLDGILIATTNLADNLDPAFDRRFLFKIQFGKTTEQARAAIWTDKIPSLSESDALRLASAYDFSGGEIDNVARKAAMQEVVSGTPATLESLLDICSKERISTGASRRIGFNAA